MINEKLITKTERRYDKNLLITEGIKDAGQDDFVMMMTENKVAGLLDMSVNTVNGMDEIEYDITSKQPFCRLFEKNEIGYEWLRALINSIDKAVRNMYGYMLDENSLMLAPEYIYVNVETKEMVFIFFPFAEEELRIQIVALAEYILDKVDHTDAGAVMLAYSLYKEVRSENFNIGALTQIMDKCETESPKASDVNKTNIKNTNIDRIERTSGEKVSEKAESTEIKNTVYSDERMDYIPETPKKSIFSIFKRKEKDRPYKANDYSPVSSMAKLPVNEVRERKEDIPKKMHFGKTVLLSEISSEDFGSLKQKQHSLTNNRTKKTYIIESLPAVIGKVSDCVDVVIDEGAISRMHAKIYEKEGAIVITDLGSTNGTFLNGLIVNEDEAVPLERGDEVGFGNVVFIWE